MLLQFVHYAIHSPQHEEQVLESEVIHQLCLCNFDFCCLCIEYFPPLFSVLAGIMALCATSSYYDVTEIATRILPNVVVLTIDPDRSHFFELFNV